MNFLAIETATDTCAVALLAQDRVLAELTLTRPRAHAENLVPLLQDALRYGGLEAGALGAVAVSMGPGSYTGLRIGVSTAKGLAAALGLRLVGVPSLEALAASVAPLAAPGDLIVPAFNARRDEVYAAAFAVTETQALAAAAETAALHVSDLAAYLEAPPGTRFWLVGDGAPKAASALEGVAAVHLLDPAVHTPSAGWVGRLAAARLARGEHEDVAGFEPFYLKEFVAKKRTGSVFERLPF